MEAGLVRDALTLLLGFATGVLSALFGVGGAIVSNPGLRALGAAPLVAVGTTLPSILPGAISGTLRYRREGLVDWRLVTPAAASGLLAVVGGCAALPRRSRRRAPAPAPHRRPPRLHRLAHRRHPPDPSRPRPGRGAGGPDGCSGSRTGGR